MKSSPRGPPRHEAAGAVASVSSSSPTHSTGSSARLRTDTSAMTAAGSILAPGSRVNEAVRAALHPARGAREWHQHVPPRDHDPRRGRPDHPAARCRAMARRRSGLRGGRVHGSRGAASVPVPTVRVAVHRAAHRASGAGPPLGLGPRHPRHRLVVVSLDRSWADPGDRRARVGADVGGDLDGQYLRGDLPRLRGGVLGPLEGSLADPAATPGRPGRGRRQGRVPRGASRRSSRRRCTAGW